MNPELAEQLAHLERRLNAANTFNEAIKLAAAAFQVAEGEDELLSEEEGEAVIEVVRHMGAAFDAIITRHGADLQQFIKEVSSDRS